MRADITLRALGTHRGRMVCRKRKTGLPLHPRATGARTDVQALPIRVLFHGRTTRQHTEMGGGQASIKSKK